MTYGDAGKRIKSHTQEPSPIRHVATFQLNQLNFFEKATDEEFNNPKGGHTHLPMIGFGVAPIMLTIYCVRKDEDWKLPLLGNSYMLHYKSEMKGKDYNFEFVVWQDLKMPFGDINPANKYAHYL